MQCDHIPGIASWQVDFFTTLVHPVRASHKWVCQDLFVTHTQNGIPESVLWMCLITKQLATC